MPLSESLVDYCAWLVKSGDKRRHSRVYAVSKPLRHGVGAPIDLELNFGTGPWVKLVEEWRPAQNIQVI
jgi:hypothetical protein